MHLGPIRATLVGSCRGGQQCVRYVAFLTALQTHFTPLSQIKPSNAGVCTAKYIIE